MIIIETNKLDDVQLVAIEALQKQCNLMDGLSNEAFLSNEINFNKELPCFFLGYEEGQLVAFLTTFMPQAIEAEVIAFTHPSYRRKGCFKALLQKAIAMLECNGIESVLFVVEPDSTTGFKVIQKYQPVEKEHSEYRLTHLGDVEISSSPNMELQEVSVENKGACLQLTEEIFQMDESENDNFIQNAMSAVDREAYLALLGGKPVGVFNLHYTEGVAFIYGLGIAPNYRGKGYGKELLGLALTKAFNTVDKVTLDVDSYNLPAYNLYIQNGFKITFQVDYYIYKYKVVFGD